MENLKNYLQINGKIIIFLTVNGVHYVAIKPICEALNINYKEQHKDIKLDSILGPASCVHRMQVPGDQFRGYFCLPERYIYGWLFSLRSSSSELLEYKKICYDILYDHFHGTLTQRQTLLKERIAVKEEIETLSSNLSSNKDYLRLNELRAKNMRMETDLKKLDELLATGQTRIEF